MKDSTRATVRTTVQVVIGLAVAVPLLVDELGLDVAWRPVAVALAVSATVTRVMQVPAVDAWLTGLGLGRQGRHEAIR